MSPGEPSVGKPQPEKDDCKGQGRERRQHAVAVGMRERGREAGRSCSAGSPGGVRFGWRAHSE